MSIYKTDFSEFSTGAKPTGWVTGSDADRNTPVSDGDWSVVADAGATGGQVLRFSDTVQTEHFISWPDIPSSEHQRAQMRWRPQGQNGSDLRMYCRADTSVPPASSSGYTLGVRSADLDLNKYTAGSFSNLNNDTGGYTAQDGTWYLTEVEVVGVNPTTLRVKTWPESGTKPSTWSETGGGPDGAINDTDATDIESGGFALFALVPDDIDIDWLVVTTAGEDPEFGATGPSITNIDGGTTFTPGASVVLNGSNFSASGGSIVINGETQTITNRTATAITFTAVRGGNPYDQDLTLTYTDADSNTATLTVQQVAGTDEYAVTAASPNTTDDASLWTGLVDTGTGDPITIVNGDQALLKDNVGDGLGNLAATPAGEISADTEGDFTVQIWLASEEVWGSDQTVTFTAPGTTIPTTPGGSAVAGIRRAMRSTMAKLSLRTKL